MAADTLGDGTALTISFGVAASVRGEGFGRYAKSAADFYVPSGERFGRNVVRAEDYCDSCEAGLP